MVYCRYKNRLHWLQTFTFWNGCTKTSRVSSKSKVKQVDGNKSSSKHSVHVFIMASCVEKCNHPFARVSDRLQFQKYVAETLPSVHIGWMVEQWHLFWLSTKQRRSNTAKFYTCDCHNGDVEIDGYDTTLSIERRKALHENSDPFAFVQANARPCHAGSVRFGSYCCLYKTPHTCCFIGPSVLLQGRIYPTKDPSYPKVR
jgi:hypothetical protein